MERAEKNLRFADVLVGTLAAAGVRHFVVSPGSRSTTLAMAAARCEGARAHVHLDERGAAFFAQAIAKSGGAPAALLCTSGTAAANYLPGIVEASLSAVPLIVLTADRPAELRDCGVPQTIDQLKLYGTNVRWFHEASLPCALETVDEYARSLALRALSHAAGPDPGPVHLNLPVREPFVPERLPPAPILEKTPAPSARVLSSEESLTQVAELVKSEPHGLLVAGPLSSCEKTRAALLRLSEATGYPVLADAASGVRFGECGGARVIVHFDALLRAGEAAAALKPALVLRLGHASSSKALNAWLERSGARQVVMGEGRRWSDPAHGAALHLHGTLDCVLDELRARVEGAQLMDPGWGASFADLDALAAGEIDAALADENEEPALARALVDALPAGSDLFVSSSMPIRDVDWFSAPASKDVRVFANRGANGIDGIVSSALGVSVGGGRASYLLTGDLALLHDVGALASAAAGGWSLSIVALNNDDGGIFGMLPVVRHEALFERYFKTPHHLNFEHLARGFGAAYERADGVEALRAWTAEASRGLRILEVPTDATAAKRLRKCVWERVAQSARAALPVRKAAP